MNIKFIKDWGLDEALIWGHTHTHKHIHVHLHTLGSCYGNSAINPSVVDSQAHSRTVACLYSNGPSEQWLELCSWLAGEGRLEEGWSAGWWNLGVSVVKYFTKAVRSGQAKPLTPTLTATYFFAACACSYVFWGNGNGGWVTGSSGNNDLLSHQCWIYQRLFLCMFFISVLPVKVLGWSSKNASCSC